MLYLVVLLFLVTPCLAVAVPPCMEWIPILKEYQAHDIAAKLYRANELLHKIWNNVSFNTFTAIYFAIFDSNINYANLIWEQNPFSKKLLLYRKIL